MKNLFEIMDDFEKISDAIDYIKDFNNSENTKDKIKNIIGILYGISSSIILSKQFYEYFFVEKLTDKEKYDKKLKELEELKININSIEKYRLLNINIDNDINKIIKKLKCFDNSNINYNIVSKDRINLDGINIILILGGGILFGYNYKSIQYKNKIINSCNF